MYRQPATSAQADVRKIRRDIEQRIGEPAPTGAYNQPSLEHNRELDPHERGAAQSKTMVRRLLGK